MCIWDKTEICHKFVYLHNNYSFFHSNSEVYKEYPGIKVAKLAKWIIVRVHDLFLISFSDGNSLNWAISSCHNAIMCTKPYKSHKELGCLVCAACC